MTIFIGYHGTLNSKAQSINKGDFAITYQKIGWLGSGIYFYEEDLALAKYWASFRYIGNNISVLRCELDVPTNKIFDITNPRSDDNKKFHARRAELLPSMIKNQLKIRVKNEKDFDGKILNSICISDCYKLVRANTYTYRDEDRGYQTFSRIPNGTELCLREVGYIINKIII